MFTWRPRAASPAEEEEGGGRRRRRKCRGNHDASCCPFCCGACSTRKARRQTKNNVAQKQFNGSRCFTEILIKFEASIKNRTLARGEKNWTYTFTFPVTFFFSFFWLRVFSATLTLKRRKSLSTAFY